MQERVRGIEDCEVTRSLVSSRPRDYSEKAVSKGRSDFIGEPTSGNLSRLDTTAFGSLYLCRLKGNGGSNVGLQDLLTTTNENEMLYAAYADNFSFSSLFVRRWHPLNDDSKVGSFLPGWIIVCNYFEILFYYECRFLCIHRKFKGARSHTKSI